MVREELIRKCQAEMPGEFANDLAEHLVQCKGTYDSANDLSYEFMTDGKFYYVTVRAAHMVGPELNVREEVVVKFQFECRFHIYLVP